MKLTDEEIETLKTAGKFHELYEVTQLMGYHERPDGGTARVKVEIREWRGGGPLRWHVYAEDEDEERRIATGNPASDLREAICTTHWFELDGTPGGA